VPVRSEVRWLEVANADQLSIDAANRILAAARDAIADHGEFRLVVAGGRTPLSAYARLARAQADWPHWQVYFSDERCRPRRDPERNDTVIRDLWLDRVPIPPNRIHEIPAELGADAGARLYATQVSRVPDFDFVLLGLGEDGHTASLFPGQPAGDAPGSPDALPVHAAPKPPPERVSLSAARLSRSRHVLFLVSGTSKLAPVAAWRAGRDIPASRVTAAAGVDVLLDQQAAGQP